MIQSVKNTSRNLLRANASESLLITILTSNAIGSYLLI